MKKTFRLATFLILIFFVSCANIENDWEKANKRNTIQSFEKFIEKYPESDFVGQANKKIISLKTDSIYFKVFSEPTRKTEMRGKLQVLMVDGGFRNNSKQFKSIRYIEHNDTIWVIHFNPSAYHSRTVNLGEEYRLVGTFLTNIDNKPNPTFLKRFDEIPDIYEKLVSSLSVSEQNFVSSDSIKKVFNFKKKFAPDVYNKLCKIYLLNQEYVFLNNYIECVQDKETSIGGKKTMSVLADTLTLANIQKPNIYTFNENNHLDLTENGKREEVKITKTGLQYEVIKEGNGAKPHETSTVTVNYEGVLTNGVIFDSSYERGEPATFPLDKVIQGWSEGLQLMSVGSKYLLYIPSNLAYGSKAVGPIPANSTLVFTIELIEVKD